MRAMINSVIKMKKKTIYEEFLPQIEKYCRENNLDFEKLKHEPRCFNSNDLIFQYHDPTKGKDGLRDETPMPITLSVKREGNGIVIEQTENTKKYLSLDDKSSGD